MLTFINRAIQAYRTHQVKEAAPTEQFPELLLSLEDMKTLAERAEQQRLADAHAAAASGEGPQPWERDWFEHQSDIGHEIFEIASTLGWHRTQDFLEVLNMALASPQGQRALAQAGDDASPWQGALEMIEELRGPLIEASHQMLGAQADGLGYTIDEKEELWEALEEISQPHNIARTES